MSSKNSYHTRVTEELADTLVASDYKDPPTAYIPAYGVASYNSAIGNISSTPKYIVRRLTPTECARLQGMPDWWCDDVPHADSAEYKMWGNGMALPNVLYVLEGIVEAMKE